MLTHRQLSRKRIVIGWVGFGMILLLCVGIMLQMLGVPVTLLDPVVSGDALGASVLEGFSVLPAMPQMTVSSESVPVIEHHPSGQVSVRAAVPFHPPLY